MSSASTAAAMAYNSVKKLQELSGIEADLENACSCFLSAMEKHFDMDMLLTRKRKRNMTKYTLQQAQQRLQYQKGKRKEEQRKACQEMPEKGPSRRIERIWHVRAGLAEATLPARALEQLLSEFALCESKAISSWSVSRTRDS